MQIVGELESEQKFSVGNSAAGKPPVGSIHTQQSHLGATSRGLAGTDLLT